MTWISDLKPHWRELTILLNPLGSATLVHVPVVFVVDGVFFAFFVGLPIILFELLNGSRIDFEETTDCLLLYYTRDFGGNSLEMRALLLSIL